jgi:LysR family positive regulator for ilvC
MDTRSLQLYVKLAEELHFGRAAQACHVSPSAATRMIQRLEGEVGATLLERDKRRVVLTHSGQDFLIYARDAIQRWREMQSQLVARQSCPRGQLRLYCSVTAAYAVLASILPAVRSRYPEIEMHLSTGDQAEAVRQVAEGHVDLAIAAHSGQIPDGVAFHSLLYSPLVCIGPVIPCQVRDQLVAGQAVAWGDVPLILPETGLVRSQLELWFRQSRLAPRIYAYVSGHEAIVSLVALGFGIGVVPQIVIDNSPLHQQIALHAPGPALEPFNIGLIARRSRLQDSLVRVVWELAAEQTA